MLGKWPAAPYSHWWPFGLEHCNRQGIGRVDSMKARIDALAWGLLPYVSLAPLAAMLLEQFVRGAK